MIYKLQVDTILEKDWMDHQAVTLAPMVAASHGEMLIFPKEENIQKHFIFI